MRVPDVLEQCAGQQWGSHNRSQGGLFQPDRVLGGFLFVSISSFWSPHPLFVLVLLPLPLCYIRFMELPLKESRHGLGRGVSPRLLTKQRLN